MLIKHSHVSYKLPESQQPTKIAHTVLKGKFINVKTFYYTIKIFHGFT